MEWLYWGTWSITSDWGDCVALYIFADRYNFLALRRELIDEMIDLPVTSYHDVEQVFAGTPGTSQLRRLVIELYSYHWEPDHDSDKETQRRHDAPQDFLSPVMGSQGKIIVAMKVGKALKCDCCHNRCSFHEHESEEECKASTFDTPRLRYTRLTASSTQHSIV